METANTSNTNTTSTDTSTIDTMQLFDSKPGNPRGYVLQIRKRPSAHHVNSSVYVGELYHEGRHIATTIEFCDIPIIGWARNAASLHWQVNGAERERAAAEEKIGRNLYALKVRADRYRLNYTEDGRPYVTITIFPADNLRDAVRWLAAVLDVFGDDNTTITACCSEVARVDVDWSLWLPLEGSQAAAAGTSSSTEKTGAQR